MSKCIGLVLITVLAVAINSATAKAQFVTALESAAFEDNAQGVLMLGDKRVDITFAAGAISTSFGKTRAHIYLANDYIDPYGRELQGEIERGDRHLVEIILDEEGTVWGFNLGSDVNKSGALMGLNASPIQFESKQLDGERIAGRVFNKEPVIISFDDHKLEIKIDANFSAALLQIGAKRSRLKDEKPSQSAVIIKKVEPIPVWGNAKTVMDEILQVTGIEVQPVYLRFGAVGEEFLHFHYHTAIKDDGIKTIEWKGGKLRGPSASNLARPCPPIPLEDIDLDLVSKIYKEVSQKTARGYSISVTLGRRSGCKKPEWQGIGKYMNKMLVISYSIDGKQTDIKEYSF